MKKNCLKLKDFFNLSLARLYFLLIVVHVLFGQVSQELAQDGSFLVKIECTVEGYVFKLQ